MFHKCTKVLLRRHSRDIQAGVGERARADARIILEGVKTEVFQQRTRESNYVVWQKQLNQGSREETLTLPSFTGPRTPSFSAPGGITVQIPVGEFRSQIASLSAQPGMGYLNELTARRDVNWQPVRLAYEQWDYKQEGLTPAGAALLAVAVAWSMPTGAGAGLLKTTGATTSAMANAAFASLAAQASITLINNKGDVGKTLKELGSSQTVKATIAAALTAGVLDKIGGTSTMRDLSRQTGFSEKLTYNLINASGRALTNTAINGGNLEDALKQALIGGLVDTAHGQVASQIKVLESQYLAHKLAHALAGCVAGAAAGGACKDGAIGGAVGEIVAEMFKSQKPGASASAATVEAYNQKVLAYSKLVAGAMSAYAGGNAQTAITTAETAVKNNFLTDKQWKEFSEKLAACKGNQACETQQRNEYLSISKAQDDALRAACTTPSSSACTTMTSQVLQGRQEQLNLYMSRQLPAMYVAGANMQGTGELIVKQATSRLNADVARAERENFTGIINAGAYYGPGAEFALEYKDGKLVNVMWGFGVGVGLLARKQAGTGVEWNVFQGDSTRPTQAPGEGRLGLSLGFQGGLGPASLNIDAISVGLHSNSNGDKGAYGTLVNINAGLTPSFGVDALGRLAVTWQYQRKGAKQ
jgi:large exoprotein involved in heme utilization and adhesion